jgi:hypothetical protein
MLAIGEVHTSQCTNSNGTVLHELEEEKGSRTCSLIGKSDRGYECLYYKK